MEDCRKREAVKRPAGFLCLLVFTACASSIRQATPEEIAAAERVQAVRVTRNSEATKGCKFLGNVTPNFVDYEARERQRRSTEILFGRRDPAIQHQEDARNDAASALYGMKFKADQLGGNVLMVVTEFPAATGESYSCPAP